MTHKFTNYKIRALALLGVFLSTVIMNESYAQTTATTGDIPIQAENYVAQSGLSTKQDGSSNDAPDISLENWGGSDYAEYDVVIPADDIYYFQYRVATARTLAQFQVTHETVSGTFEHEIVDISGTGGWQTYTTLTSTTPIYLTTGTHTFRLHYYNDAFNINWFSLSDDESVCPPAAVAGYLDDGTGEAPGSEVATPINEGKSVTFAPDASDGGSGTWSWTGPNSFSASTQDVTISNITSSELGTYTVSYTDPTCTETTTRDFRLEEGFAAGTIQAEDWTATIEDPDGTVETEPTTDNGGGSNASYLDAGDWIEYSVDIASAGDYLIDYRIANNSGSEGSYILSIAGSAVETVYFPNTGGWQNWDTFTTGEPITLASGTQTWRVTMNSNSTNFNWFRVYSADDYSVWDGETSTDWHTASNWHDDVLPTSGDDVIIPGTANAPVITSDVDLNSINVVYGATLTVSSGTVDIAGDVAVLGDFIVESGASLITYETAFTMEEVTFERNTNGSYDGYSLVGSPVEYDAGITGADLGEVTWYYDETEAYAASGGARWKDADTEALNPGVGYAQARQSSISFTGVPNTGDITISGLTYTSGTAGEQGWQLLSNPYGSAIDGAAFIAGNAGLDAALYFYDDNQAAGSSNADYLMVSSLGTVDQSGPNSSVEYDGYIGSMQGFFVKLAAVGTTDVTFTEAMRAVAQNADANFFRMSQQDEPMTIKLAISNEEGLYNELIVGLTSDATLGVDRLYDATKLIGNQDVAFYSLINDGKYAAQGLPYEEGVFTELGFDLANAGDLTLSVVEMSAGMSPFYVTDKLTGEVYDMSEVSSIDFTASEGSDQNRFTLTYGSSANTVSSLENTLTSNEPIYRYADQTITVDFAHELDVAEFAVYDLAGRVQVRSVEGLSNTQRIAVPVSAKGISILRVVTSEGTFTRKFNF